MTPNRHLDDATLLAYSAGALSQALAVVACAHMEHCAHCRGRLGEADRVGGALVGLQQPAELAPGAREAMLALLEDTPRDPMPPSPPDPFAAPDPDRLPAALHPWFGDSMRALRWRRVAPGVQRISAHGVSGGQLFLLRIAPGSRLPLHSHQGSELTLILDGAYTDMLGHFGPGDVADLDENVRHQPVTTEGVPCVCVAALDAPLRFSGWLARGLQPFLRF
ncbi:MAG: ChrR family anti-sigma-E factor [Luteimonas sp.]